MTRPTLLLITGLTAFLVYVTTLGNQFAYDDGIIIEENPRVTEAARMGEILTTPYWGSRAGGGLYRPVASFSYALNHRLHGLQPFGYHLVNVLLHAAVSVLLTLVALEYLPLLAAMLAGLIFAVHPIHTEAVANVVGRAELLSALGFLAAWLAARRVSGGAWTWGYRILAGVGYAFGLFSKEVAVVLPLVLLVSDWIERRRIDRPLYGVLLLAAVGYFALRWQVLGAIGLPKEFIISRLDNVIATQPLLPGLWTALSVLGRYLVLLVFPWRLSADYSWAQITEAGIGEPWAWVGLFGVVALSALLAFAVHRRAVAARGTGTPTSWPAVTAGLLIFGAAILPVSNLVVRIGTVMGERLLYLPSAGAAIVMSAGLFALWQRLGVPSRRVLAGVVALLLVAGGARCLMRGPEWKNDLTLHATTLKTSPKSARAHFNMAPSLWASGRQDEAIDMVREAIRIEPTYTEAWTNLGGYLVKGERYDEARVALKGALAISPLDELAALALGALELETGRPRESIPWFEQIVRANPRRAEAWFDLGLARQAIGDTMAAVAAFRAAVASKPSAPDPDAQNNLAWLLTLRAKTSAEREAAVLEARQGVALRPDAAAWDTLGEALLRAGRVGEAREAFEKAIALGAANPDSIRARLTRAADGGS
ncbi:MAG: tetratricopeptide repeat protein [Candidatus Eisenbacteria bacterium]|nr:tetratricopeptide repeat protein [Candidatus Eisenbacteria bacterium]